MNELKHNYFVRRRLMNKAQAEKVEEQKSACKDKKDALPKIRHNKTV